MKLSGRLVLVHCWLLFATFSNGVLSLRSRIPRFRPSILHKGLTGVKNVREDLLSQCEERWRDATLDHFTWAQGADGVDTFQQRYFVCDKNFGVDSDGFLGPIFFYLGNEADVTLYLNNTGLMWENAPNFKALLVFAEHRYYGKSLPYGDAVRDHMQYLTAEQAMADYAELINEIKQSYNATSSPVIGFGGSYGGMLASWMRMKYPHILDGAIAGSAPIWTFLGETPDMDPLFYSKGVTHDASPEGGAVPHCADNVRKGWKLMMKLADTDAGRAQISSAMGLCDGVPLDSREDVMDLRNWLSAAWDFMAMGNFPYPSGYILNGHGLLPAFPVRVACEALGHKKMSADRLLSGLAQAAGVFYNFTGSLTCFDYRQDDTGSNDDFWGYQYCTEMLMPIAKDGDADMFWSEPWDVEAVVAGCQQEWGVTPRRYWAQTEWGGRKIGAASRIAFSNGLLDPWHGGGVLEDVNPQLPALIIPEGAHHLDLMFSHPDDPESVKAVRRQEVQLMKTWIAETRAGRVKQEQRQDVSGHAPGRTHVHGGRSSGSHVMRRDWGRKVVISAQ